MTPLGLQPPLHRRRLDFFRKSFYFSLRKAREVLGFEPRTGFAEGARTTADWYRENGLL
jgi:nucleoside-diphosphate-sugar epimerase